MRKFAISIDFGQQQITVRGMAYPKVSFHGGHSADFCDHAKDTKQTILQGYYEAGFSHLALTEHMPPEFDQFLYPEEIDSGHSASYIQKRFGQLFTDLRPQLQQYATEKFDCLLLGFETEFCGPTPERWIAQHIESYCPDIVVASVHHVNDIPLDFSEFETRRLVQTVKSQENLVCRYLDQQERLIRLLSSQYSLPVVVGHFDLYRKFLPEMDYSETVWHRIVRNIRLGVEAGFLFEINSRAVKNGLSEPYPGRKILSEIRKQGGCITFGDDSHSICDIGAYYREALDHALTAFSEYAVFEASGNRNFRIKNLPL